MTSHRAILLYLAVLHGGIGLAGGICLWPDRRPWILALEAGLLLSALVAYHLLRRLRLPREMMNLGTEWMREGDFNHAFRLTGLEDLDGLVRLYNGMVERLRDERARLEEQEIFLHKLLEASPAGIVTTDHDGRIDRINPAAARQLELEPPAFQGRRPTPLDPAILRQLFEVPLGASHLLGQRGRRRLKCTHSRFFDRSFPRSFFLVEDLTHELWASEKAAYHSLIRTLAHEVNNTIGATNSILHSVLAYRDQIQSEDREDFGTALEVAIQRTDHLGAFMHRYAEVVRVPAPVKRPTEPGALLERIAQLMKAEGERRDVRFILDLAEDIEPISLDETQLEQVLVNVARNALEAIERDGTVTLRLRREAEWVRLEVEDSGPGLSPEAKENLFTPFFSTKSTGQGIGLTLVREILNLHGFAYSLESPVDGPTRFSILIRR